MKFIYSLIKYFLSFNFIKFYRNVIGKKLLSYKSVEQNFDKSIEKETCHFNEKNKKIYEPYKTYYTIPDDGLYYDECMDLIKEYYDKTLLHIKNKQFSGTIYQDTLNEDIIDLHLPKTLESLYIEIFRRSYMWNALHDKEFHIANLINLQLVACVSELFGGDIKNTHGLVTTGGTQSIMVAARSYVNWGKDEKKVKKCVIIAPDTMHASLIKAKESYGFNLVLVPTNDKGEVNIRELCDLAYRHQKNLAALFCSFPSYPYGTKDNIYVFADLAKKYQCGLHVDCCLGGFIINFIDEDAKYLFNLSGVTSISIDTHKNGLAPKGSSVLLMKQLGKHNLLYHSIYTFTNWKGGLYGTPKDEGSASCVEAFCALITLLFNGKRHYQLVADKIHSSVNEIVDNLSQNNLVEIINPDNINVVALRLKLKSGATYYLADLMNEKGFEFSTLTHDIIHFCITKRFVTNEETTKHFIELLNETINSINDEIIRDPSIEFDGSARLYCSVDKINQVSTNQSFGKYIENYFFGDHGICVTIKKHFMSINNPNSATESPPLAIAATQL